VQDGVISIDSEIMSGEPCFAGTRVPVKNFWDALLAGESIDDFLDGFPTVKREQLVALLTEGRDKTLAPA
jgi:uncharacterized protein (DUF433 family)